LISHVAQLRITDVQTFEVSGDDDAKGIRYTVKDVLASLTRPVHSVLQATTLTANGRAVAAAAARGVQLEAHVHRAVWLTGF